MRLRPWLLLASVIGCRQAPTASSAATLALPNLTGVHALLSYEGQPLPVNLGDIPTRTGAPTGCFTMLNSGMLQIFMSGTTGSFTLQYGRADSCTGGFMGSDSWSGQLSWSGGLLTLQSIGSDGVVTRTTVRVTDDSILFDNPTWKPRLAFGRATIP